MGYTGAQKREYQRLWISRRRESWINKHGPCIDCNSWENLEVDHVDPKQKLVNPTIVWNWTKSKRDEELCKCVVRCQACHKTKTAKERRTHWQHGTYHMYRKTGCRCALCVTAQRVYKRDHRKNIIHSYNDLLC